MDPRLTHPNMEALVSKVADLGDDLSDAIDGERNAEAEILIAAIALVRPALRALSSALPGDSRGLILEHSGVRFLAVTEEGGLCEFSGSPLSLLQITARRAMSTYEVWTCVATLQEKLQQYASGNAERTAQKARDRAARLGAVLTLLK